MLYGCFRLILIFFSLACLILTCFAVTGSYENKSYLTPTYLINFHLNGLDLKKIIDDSVGSFGKRQHPDLKRGDVDLKREDTTATPTIAIPTGLAAAATSLINQPGFTSNLANVASSVGISIPSSVPTSTGEIVSTVQAAIADLLNNVTPAELGIADVYSTSFWGYCRGERISNGTTTFDNALGRFIDQNFDNSKVNYTWCSPPKAGFFFDPVEIFKQEMNRTIDGVAVDTQSQVVNQLSAQYKNELKVLIGNLTNEDLHLPGDLQKNLETLNNLTLAGFALMVIAACLSFISIIFQLLAFCLSPDSCCLSFLNFMFQFAIFIISILGAALITGCYAYVRRLVNENVGDFGIKSFLSINFYAFAWSAAVAALLVVIFNLLGHCCGCFGTGRRRYRRVETVAYEHHGEKY
ncbi:hypothetical protein KGF56_004340 [Candida oxycetoniae]|uniref:Uncharacterized protein n=1 Tax=Candida oxycetoniae TaxID=497107 RepID=A0AAI9SUR1_9ASCO|nr:uncharacterized protein KGF56_004340 [Candida oxycetoniae]KAI3402879.1 hypothetical protein KGF56_004340 [Candida oxycetoniae]